MDPGLGQFTGGGHRALLCVSGLSLVRVQSDVSVLFGWSVSVAPPYSCHVVPDTLLSRTVLFLKLFECSSYSRPVTGCPCAVALTRVFRGRSSHVGSPAALQSIVIAKTAVIYLLVERFCSNPEVHSSERISLRSRSSPVQFGPVSLCPRSEGMSLSPKRSGAQTCAVPQLPESRERYRKGEETPPPCGGVSIVTEWRVLSPNWSGF